MEARHARRWSDRRALIAEAVLIAVLAVVTIATLRWQAVEQNFSVDESRWISTSRYFWITFVEGDLFGPEWQPNYIVMTHPPVARYLIGFGLWLQGWSPEQLNGRFDTDRSWEYNRRAGNIPSDELLAAARRVVFPFAVGAMLLLYAIGRTVAGPAGGAAAVVLAVANPLLATAWTRALAEAMLAFFSLVGLLLAVRVLPRLGLRKVHPSGPVGLGVALGLATATKLSGLLGALGVGLFAVLQYVAAWRAGRRVPVVGSWVDAALPAVIAFIVVNPLLYPDPVGRTVALFEHRRDEMEYQALMTPRQAVPPDLGARAEVVYRRAFLEFGTLHEHLSLPVDAPLAAAGLGIALLASWRAWRKRVPFGPLTVLACWALSTYLVSTASLGFNSSHYFIPIAMVSVILQGVALVTGARWLMDRLWRARQARLAPAAS